MKLNDFGLLLTSAINSTNPNAKKELITISEKERDLRIINQEKEAKKREVYLNTYEYNREKNRILYDEYLANRRILYNKWKESKTIASLQQLLSYNLPEINEVPDVYTAHIKKSKLLSK